MIQLVPYSTIVSDEDDLGKINSFLSKIRKPELKTFQVNRLNKGAVSILLEVQFGERFQIVASSPEDGAFLQNDRPGTWVDVVFSEPVSEDSLIPNIFWNGIAVSSDRLILSHDNYKLRILSSADNSVLLAIPGDQRIEFGLIRSEGFDDLVGKRVISWTSSKAGGSKRGRQPKEVSRRGLAIGRMSVEQMSTPSDLLSKFVNQHNILIQDIVQTKLVGSTNEFEKTELYVVYEADEPASLVQFVAPQNGACLYWDTSELLEIVVSVTFDHEVDTSALNTSIYFDDVQVDPSYISYYEDDYVVEVVTHPSDYGHHWLEINTPTNPLVGRIDPFFSTYVIHSLVQGSGGGTWNPPDLWSEHDVVIMGPTGEVPPNARVITGVATTKRKFLSQQGDGVNANQPAWVDLVDADNGPMIVSSIQTSTYNASIGEVVKVDPTGGPFIVTLPSVTGNSGRIVVVKNTTSSTTPVSVDTGGAPTIDGDPVAIINVGHQSYTFMCDGSDWSLI